MNEQPANQMDETGSSNGGPRVLCLHPTASCAHDCAPCYLKRNRYGEEKPLAFFAQLVREAAQSDSIHEVALGVNIDPPGITRNAEALAVISREAHAAGIRLTVTTNYENVKAWGAKAFRHCDLVSLSLDEYKFPSLRLPGDYFDQVTKLQAEGRVVNLCVLLSGRLLDHLTLPRLRRWLGLADQVYLLIPKHFSLDFSREELLRFFERVAPIWEEPDRFFHLQLDNCIRPQVFPWNQLAPTCDWADNLVNVLPDGGLALCAMDHPQTYLNGADSLLPAVHEYYVAQRRDGRSRCPFMEFRAA